MKRIFGAVISGGLFAALTVMLGRYDVAAIGPQGTVIGFSNINKTIHDITGVNMFWYDVTDYIGYAAIGICLLFAVVGLVQLIKRRSLLKVDTEILALGGLFAADIACYVFFEKYIINYRPIIMPGASEPEASFPSSHTVLILTVMIAVMIVSERYMKGGLGALVRFLCFMIALGTVAGRLWCGVHWFTDIIGGIFLSATLLFLFVSVVQAGRRKRETSGKTEGGYKPKH